ncbi:hypothetical protein CVT26_015829 [Gymnopilus dilepis]|uniref:Uncharacterized protein n=1 Tax=Gymnopilus dilepis TaxID=231916 RepID=A0A409W4M0_9AGAR|nr:hypothetical protein CVT26_015829 [Gymnopilus dilepis]
MLPFGLKIAWFILSLTGLLGCFIFSWAFARTAGSKWCALLYCVGNLLLQGMFCLGMIYRMDPFDMPQSFCIVQNTVMSFGTFLLTGITLVYSMATSMAVNKPKTWGDSGNALRWQNTYAIPLVVFPVLASAIHIPLVLKLNSLHPSDDMFCDSSSPEWVRFLGYAGLPFVALWPALYLSIRSILQIHKTNQHLLRARTDSIIDDFTAAPKKKRRSIKEISLSSTKPKRHVSVRREPISPAIESPALVARKFHLPFNAPLFIHSTSESRRASRQSNQLGVVDQHSDDASSRVSVTLPTFANPSDGLTLVDGRGERGGGETPGGGDHDDVAQKDREWEQALAVACGSDSIHELDDADGDWNEDKGELSEPDSSKDGYVMAEAVPYSGSSSRPTSVSLSATGIPYKKPRREPPGLSPFLWQIILFQFAFIFVQFLACISTFVDVVTRRATPTALGTHHFALLLAAWGPVFMFGMLPLFPPFVIWTRSNYGM